MYKAHFFSPRHKRKVGVRRIHEYRPLAAAWMWLSVIMPRISEVVTSFHGGGRPGNILNIRSASQLPTDRCSVFTKTVCSVSDRAITIRENRENFSFCELIFTQKDHAERKMVKENSQNLRISEVVTSFIKYQLSWLVKVASVLEVSQSRDQNSDRVCNFTHVVSGGEAIHHVRDHVRTVPIEVGTARVHVQCSRCCRNRSTCVCTWTHRKRMLQYGASEKIMLIDCA